MTTEAQNRALWATALRNLAQAIGEGYVQPPTSLDIWTQYVTPSELLVIADGSYTSPLPISIVGSFATVRVPTGELLDLNITWSTQSQLRGPDADQFRRAFETHNTECMVTTAPDDTAAV